MNKLGKSCKDKIVELTIDEDRHAEDNPYVMEHCAVVAKDFCAQYLNDNAEEEALFDCLVDAKPQIAEDQPKCYAAITHFQLIALEDVKFSRKFEKACQEDIARFCYDQRLKTQDAKTNEEIIECLSEVALEEALGEAERGETLHPRCKKQLVNQLRREEENVEVNPRLRKMCKADISQFCGDVHKDSGGKVVECLKEHFPELRGPCRDFLFRRDVVNVREDSRGDFALNEHCHGMVQKYKCRENTLECLKAVKDEPGFDERCHVVILRRMIEHSYDFRLNPALHGACKLDIGKFCSQKLLGHSVRMIFDESYDTYA
jgi:Golgi apparatus protein 1